MANGALEKRIKVDFFPRAVRIFPDLFSQISGDAWTVVAIRFGNAIEDRVVNSGIMFSCSFCIAIV